VTAKQLINCQCYVLCHTEPDDLSERSELCIESSILCLPALLPFTNDCDSMCYSFWAAPYFILLQKFGSVTKCVLCWLPACTGSQKTMHWSCYCSLQTFVAFTFTNALNTD